VRQLSVREREERQGGGGLTRRTQRSTTALGAPPDNASASKTIFSVVLFQKQLETPWETVVMRDSRVVRRRIDRHFRLVAQ
jgi:hypothetical protein